LFLADAFLENEQPLRWNREEILSNVVNRERRKLKKNLESVAGRDDKLTGALMRPTALSTMIDGMVIPKDAETFFRTDWNIVEAKASNFDDGTSMLLKADLAYKDQENRSIIAAIKPDLIGEYL
jgi:hypothetical protein